MGAGVSLGDFGANPVERRDPLVLGDSDAAPRDVDDGHVADSEVLRGPVENQVGVGPAAERAEDGADQVAAAAEAAGTEAEQIVGRERQELGAVEIQQRLPDRRPALGQLGTLKQRQRDQLGDGDRVGDQRVGNDPGVGRVEPDRGIDVDHLGEPRRGHQYGPFGGLEFGLAAGELGGRPVGVRLRAPAFLRICRRELSDDARLVANLHRDRSLSLGAEQVRVGQRRPQERLVADRRGGELRTRTSWIEVR